MSKESLDALRCAPAETVSLAQPKPAWVIRWEEAAKLAELNPEADAEDARQERKHNLSLMYPGAP